MRSLWDPIIYYSSLFIKLPRWEAPPPKEIDFRITCNRVYPRFQTAFPDPPEQLHRLVPKIHSDGTFTPQIKQQVSHSGKRYDCQHLQLHPNIMPPDRIAPKTKPFKPQRPSTGGASTPRVSSSAVPTSSRATVTTQSSRPSQSSTSRPAGSDPVEASDSAADLPTETIPPELLTTLLHEFFVDEHTRISKGANRAVGKYMETFVREAIARANYERNGNGATGGGDGFLEVCICSRTRR